MHCGQHSSHYSLSESEIYGVQKHYMVTDVTDNVPDIPDDVMNNFEIYIFLSMVKIKV